MPLRQKLLLISVEFDDEKTDLESIAHGLDRLMDTVKEAWPDVWEDYGGVRVGAVNLLSKDVRDY